MIRDEDFLRVTYKDHKYRIPMDFMINDHPGGKKIVRNYKNRDVTDAFDSAEHPEDAVVMLEGWMEDPPRSVQDRIAERQRQKERSEKMWQAAIISFTAITICSAFLLK